MRFARERFDGVWRALRLASPQHDPFGALRDRHSESHRAYHTAQHIEECLGWVDAANADAEVELALWFHDAIYEPSTPDNELRSAEWATAEITAAGGSDALAASIHALIMATRHEAVPDTPAAQLVVDIDLSILGAPRQRFDEYENQVRQEYAWVPHHGFRQARAAILRSFLARPSIYSTGFFRERLEAQARANLEASIARLAER